MIGTGVSGLDLILRGGLAARSLHVITGAPGTGKTILAQSILFSAARQGIRSIYFTCVSEPHEKLIAHLSALRFFDPQLLGRQVDLINISPEVIEQGGRQLIAFVTGLVRHKGVGLIAIDSFRGLKHMLPLGTGARATIFDLTAQLSVLDCTTLLLGEYTPAELETEPEFAIADGIIQLVDRELGLYDRRLLRVQKLRGVDHLTGYHPFRITAEGLAVFPRQEALTGPPIAAVGPARVSSGVPDLDEMLEGGLLANSATLVAGSPGIGKTLLGLHFLAAPGEGRGLMIAFQESPAQLARRAEEFGLTAGLDLQGGRTILISLTPTELVPDEVAHLIRETVERRGIRRLVLDGVTELFFSVEVESRRDDFLASLVNYLRERGVTSLVVKELFELFGGELPVTAEGVSFICDNLIMLRYVAQDSALKRAITVVKTRSSAHDSSVRELRISQPEGGVGGIRIGPRFGDVSGILPGIPRALGAEPP